MIAGSQACTKAMGVLPEITRGRVIFVEDDRPDLGVLECLQVGVVFDVIEVEGI
jgi:hypothetical protein